jgi:hypothetical protein
MIHYALQNNIRIAWEHMMADYEIAVKNALQEILHDRIDWNGCYFH